ncbi:MAG: carbohydrate ABC transporter permease [Clostridiales bacterium]|nr:carbohydrate ABC transporter permease [Clostridiales bacterium]
MIVQSSTKIKEAPRERFIHAVIIALLVIFGLVMLIPVLYIFSTAFSPTPAIARHGMILIPIYGFDFSTVGLMLSKNSGILRAYGNTILITVGGTSIGLLTTSMLAYAISKSHMPGVKIYKGSLIFTMLFGGGLIPTYLVIKWLGLIDTYWAMILPSICSTYNTMLIMRYFESIGPSMEESAKIDGANDLQIFFRIYVPVSIPILITIGVFLFDGYWNSWFGPMMYINKDKMLPVQCILRQMMQSSRFTDLVDGQHASEISSKPSTQLQCSVIVITVVPLIVLFPFMQKYFIKGIMLGAVKE